MPLALCVRNESHRAKLVYSTAVCGRLDIDDPQPITTLTLPAED